MTQAQIPTAAYQIFNSPQELRQFTPQQWPWVFKLDGLAAGKGVLIAKSKQEIDLFSESIWQHHTFGSGPHRILAEAFLEGREISYIGFCDGNHFIPLETATDYKRIFDHDQGPNTGGMGAISPSPYFSAALKTAIDSTIIVPLLQEMKRRKMDFKGILFIGLMVDVSGKPSVLEFNTRFGDPETQCVLPRLKSSLLSLLLDTAKGSLPKQHQLLWDPEVSIYVVACTKGYPGEPQKGDLITGIESIPADTQLFFGGVSVDSEKLVTRGGRVLGIGTLAPSSSEARTKAYHYLNKIRWDGIHYRKDIGL
jgi:phosphoribosylamine--glycine ligase